LLLLSRRFDDDSVDVDVDVDRGSNGRPPAPTVNTTMIM